MVVARLRNLRVSVIHLYSRSPAVTGVASGSFRLGFPIFPSGCENPYRSSNGSAGCPASIPRPSLVCKRLGSGNRLGCPDCTEHRGSALFGKSARRQRGNQMPPVSDQRDGSGRYQTTSGPEEPLPLRQLILLNRDDDIRAWFLANNGHDPLDLLVLESRPEDGEHPDQTPEPPDGTLPFFDGKVWNDSAGAEYVTREMQKEEEWIDEDEWLQAELEGATRAPSGAGVIIVDDGDISIQTKPAHMSRQDSELPM